jgi:hypothetical protein
MLAIVKLPLIAADQSILDSKVDFVPPATCAPLTLPPRKSAWIPNPGTICFLM